MLPPQVSACGSSVQDSCLDENPGDFLGSGQPRISSPHWSREHRPSWWEAGSVSTPAELRVVCEGHHYPPLSTAELEGIERSQQCAKVNHEGATESHFDICPPGSSKRTGMLSPSQNPRVGRRWDRYGSVGHGACFRQTLVHTSPVDFCFLPSCLSTLTHSLNFFPVNSPFRSDLASSRMVSGLLWS